MLEVSEAEVIIIIPVSIVGMYARMLLMKNLRALNPDSEEAGKEEKKSNTGNGKGLNNSAHSQQQTSKIAIPLILHKHSTK